MKILSRIFLSISLWIFGTSICLAAPDFYGVKMTSEYHSRGLVVDESGPSPQIQADKPGMDKSVYAYATLNGRDFKIQVFNKSTETIQSDYDYAEYTVIGHDGERHQLKPPDLFWTTGSAIPPNKSAWFAPSFSGSPLQKKDIRAVVCSFDLGNLKIILLPLSKKAAPFKETPKPPAPPVKKEPPVEPKPVEKKLEDKKTEEKKSFFAKMFEPKKETKPAIAKKAEAPKPISKPAKPVSLKPIVPAIPDAPAPKPKKTVETPKPAPKPAPAPKVETSQKPAARVKPKKIPVDEVKLLDQYEKSQKPRQYWRVEEVQEGFAVINLGAKDGLKPGSIVQIARDGEFIAQATVRRLTDSYATVFGPDLAKAKTGDDVLFFDATS